MAQEIPFEYIGTAIETVRGTAIAAPTKKHYMNGMMMPKAETYYSADQSGLLAEYTRSTITRKWSELDIDGDLDPNDIHRWLAAGLLGTVTPVLVAGAVNKWTFTRNMLVDSLKTLTLFWGDPNTKVWQAPYGMVTEIGISADGKGTDASKFSAKLVAAEELALGAAPATPANPSALMTIPGQIELWMETTSAAAYGTTVVTNRLLGLEHTIPTGVVQKFGPGSLTVRRTGLVKTHPTTKIELEVLTSADYDTYKALVGAPIRIRARHSTAALIDATNRGYVEVNMYGAMSDLDWDSYENANRTIKFSIEGIYDPTIATDCQVVVQNLQAAL